MSYVIAAYAVTLLTLLGYGVKLAAEARRLREQLTRTDASGR